MNDNGEHVGGMTGFLRSIGMSIRQFRPSRCVIIFDGKGGSQRRRKLYSEYKENRKPMERLNRTYDFQTKDEEIENQRNQLIRLVEYLRHLPITIITIDNVEADDVIAYLANLIAERDGEAIIMSSDKDFLQLVTPKIKIWNPIKKKIYDEKTVVEEYGIHPNNFIIYRSMDGDKSDNINGIKGVGLVTLKKLFPELINPDPIPWEHIFAAAEDNDKSKLCKLILENKDVLKRNIDLMRLDIQQMSGQSKIKILDIFDGKIPNINKVVLTQMLFHDRLSGAFANLDHWLMTTFNSILRFSDK